MLFWVLTPKYSIVFKGGPAPIFMTPTPYPNLLPLFKIFVSPPLVSVPPPFKVFQTVSPTLTQPPPALIWSTNLPYIVYCCVSNILFVFIFLDVVSFIYICNICNLENLWSLWHHHFIDHFISFHFINIGDGDGIKTCQ